MLGVLRIAAARPLLRVGVRSMHTTAVARAQSLGPQNPAPERVKPASPAYFTTKPSYIDTLQMLDQLTREVKRELEQSYILPRNSKPPPLPQGPTNIWITREVLHSRLGINLRASQYRSVISRLTLLLRYRALVLENFTDAKASAFAERSTTHQRELASKVEEVFGAFMSTHGKAQDAQEKRTTPLRTSTRGYIDEQGRVYARGRRKESSARVWLVPAKDAETTLGAVLVNGAPLSQYFTRTQHREQVVWPLKLAGVLGQYNIFALTRGGGQSGQAGAIAHGIANALVAQLASMPGDEAATVHEHVKHLLAKGSSSHTLTQMAFSTATRVWSSARSRVWPRRARHSPGSSVSGSYASIYSSKHSPLLGAHAADLDGGLVGHYLDHVADLFALACHDRTEHGLTALTEAIPEHLDGVDPPSRLVFTDARKDAQRRAVAGLVARPSRFFEADRAAARVGQRLTRGHGQRHDGIVAR